MPAGDLKSAVASLMEALAHAPQNPLVHYNLGKAYRALGDDTKAEQYLRQAATLQPQLAEAHIALGEIHAVHGRADPAIDSFQAALSAGLTPAEESLTFNRIARCYAHIGNTDSAINFAVQALLVNPTSAATTYLATQLYQTGRQADAPKLFAQYAGSASTTLLMCFGQLFIQLEQREMGIAAYDLCAERRPLVIVSNAEEPATWAQSSPFSAERPSPRYHELVSQYKRLHQEAQASVKGKGQMFEGIVGFAIVAPYVRRFAQKLGAQIMLDYGGGRGAQYRLGEITIGSETFESSLEYLGLHRAVCFDPGLDEAVPSDLFDLVICVDALEHCDRQDLPWIVRSLFQRARLGVFANVASYAAGKTLPNGENAHCTVEDAPWWMGLFRAVANEFPAIAYEVIVSKDLQQNTRIAFGRSP